MRPAIIIGAGPAGLTAAVELTRRTDFRPIVFEMDDQVGGLSRTVVHNGNRIDIGGHRFFSKSDRVMDWWLSQLPLEKLDHRDVAITYHNRTRALSATPSDLDPAFVNDVMLLRQRRSRIFYQGQLFHYPLTLDRDTIAKLGLQRMLRIGLSYARAAASPRPEHTLEDFLINRFGRELYRTFFADYTEKVWGRPCDQISAAWGAQRIKGLSLRKALAHFLQRAIPGSPSDLGQKRTETSLIERFLYPKLGPGQMWETAAREMIAAGGA
ncbi:MAG: NAD(P)-binding protein, partial [Myxococcota bacterium]